MASCMCDNQSLVQLKTRNVCFLQITFAYMVMHFVAPSAHLVHDHCWLRNIDDVSPVK